MKETMFYSDEFSQRHNSISENDQKKMLSEIGVKSMDELINLTIPDSIRLKSELNLEMNALFFWYNDQVICNFSKIH